MSHLSYSFPTFLAAIILLAHGASFLFRKAIPNEFCIAVHQPWAALKEEMKVVLLSLMRLAGAGMVAVSFLLIALQWQFSTAQQTWIPPTVIVAGSSLAGGWLYAFFQISGKTLGRPAVFPAMAVLLLLTVGYFMNIQQLPHL